MYFLRSISLPLNLPQLLTIQVANLNFKKLRYKLYQNFNLSNNTCPIEKYQQNFVENSSGDKSFWNFNELSHFYFLLFELFRYLIDPYLLLHSRGRDGGACLSDEFSPA